MKPSGNQLVIIFEIVALLTWPISVSRKQQQQLAIFSFFGIIWFVFGHQRSFKRPGFLFTNWGCRSYVTSCGLQRKTTNIGRPKLSGHRCRGVSCIYYRYIYVWDAYLNRERLYGLLFRMSAHIRSWFTDWDSFGIYYKSNQVQWIMRSVSFQFKSGIKDLLCGTLPLQPWRPQCIAVIFCRV